MKKATVATLSLLLSLFLTLTINATTATACTAPPPERHPVCITVIPQTKELPTIPDGSVTLVTRGAVIQALAHAACPYGQFEISDERTFEDAGIVYGLTGEIEFTVLRGFIQGYPDGSLQPDKPISWKELCRIVCRFYGISVINDEANIDPDGRFAIAAVEDRLNHNHIRPEPSRPPEAHVNYREAGKVFQSFAECGFQPVITLEGM